MLVRDGLAMLVRRGDVVVRVRAVGDRAVAEREVAVAGVLSVADVPHTPLAERAGQPWTAGDHVVTAWGWVDPVRAAGPQDLGALASKLRRRTVATASSGAVAGFDPIAAALGAVDHVPAGDSQVDAVRARADELRAEWADVAAAAPAAPGGLAIVHGDLHRDNVVVGADGPLLTDLELAGVGPPAYDVAPAVVAVERYGADRTDLDSFLHAAGWDPRSHDAFPTCVAVYELWLTAWAVGVRGRSTELRAEAAHRIASLTEGGSHRWKLH